MNAKIGSVVLGARDLDRALRFYRDIIGFLPMHVDPAQNFALFDAGGIALKIVGGHQATSAMHAAIEIIVNDLDQAYAELSAKGVVFPMPPRRQPWGGRLAQLQDLDGNLFYLAPATESHEQVEPAP